MSFTPTYTEKDLFGPARLYIMAGVPGCGKTTWARNFFRDYQRVSTDEIRAELWPGEDYDNAHNQVVFDTFHQRLYDLLRVGGDVVADATSLQSESRRILRDIADKKGAEAHLVFFANPAQALLRNGQRVGFANVPPPAMEVMFRKWEASRSAILDEEYTSTTIIEET